MANYPAYNYQPPATPWAMPQQPQQGAVPPMLQPMPPQMPGPRTTASPPSTAARPEGGETMRPLTRMMLLGGDDDRRRREDAERERLLRGYIPDYQPPYMGWDAWIASRPNELPRRPEPMIPSRQSAEPRPWISKLFSPPYDWSDGADATVRRDREMDRLPGNRATSGHTDSSVMGPLDLETAEEWTSTMCNADGTRGPHWTVDQVRQVIAQRGLKVDLPAFYAVLNAIYSDYVEVAKAHGIGDQLGYYIDMALAWLDDEDAVPDKAATYYNCIVKH